ncbi:MAG: N-acetylmuramic acid 6-phosphate etherase [Armatimonadota bacterium]
MTPEDSPRVDYAALATEGRNPRSMDLDRLSAEAVLRLISDEDRRVPDAVAAEIPNIARAVDAVVGAIGAGGRVIYVGAGTSGRIGLLDALEWPPTFGVDPDIIRVVIAGGAGATVHSSASSEDDAAAGAAEIAALGAGPRDVVVGIAASGVTPFTVSALREARRRGCMTVALCNVPRAPLAEVAAIAIAPVVGPEVLTGSTRMKAGTAQKMVLNMLSTAAMVRLGKVYSNLMVDMPPRNRKLQARAARMVAQATGLDVDASGRLLDEAGGSVKVAIVMALAGVGRADAERRLDGAGGHVRRAIESGRGADDAGLR